MHRRIRSMILLAAAIGFGIVSTGAADDKSWVGQNVLPTKRSKEIAFWEKVGDKETRFRYSGLTPVKVREEREGLIRFHDGHREGWASKSDFVPVREAPEYFNRRIETNPHDFWALFMRGTGWSDKGDYDKAIADLDEAIRADPTYPPAFNNRALCWRNKKDYDKAIRDLDEAVRLDPKYALGYANRGTVWKTKKDYDRAIRDADESLRLDPKNSRYLYNRADTFRAKKEYDNAIRDFDEAIRLDSKMTMGYYGKAACLVVQGKKDEGLDSLRQAFDNGYRNIKALANDHAFDSVRNDPRYEELVKKYTKP